MKPKTTPETESLIRKGQEITMLRRLLEKAVEFYQDPENVKAYEEWLKNKKSSK